MVGKAQVTRDRIVEEKVLDIGRDFAKSLQPGIDSTIAWKSALEDLKQVALSYSEVEKQFKVAKGRKEFLELKIKEEKLRKDAAVSLAAEEKTLVAIQKTKQSLINTEKKSLALATQKERRQKSVIKLTEKEKLEIRLLNRGRREAAVLSSKLSTEYEKQSVILTRLRRKYKDVALKEGEASKNAKLLATRILKLDAALKRVDANVGQFQRSVGNYSKAMRSAAGAARAMASAIGLTSGAFLAVQIVRDAIKVIRDFEKQNATLSAILQISRGEMKGLTDDSIRLGESTVKTAGQVTGLQIAYARLGFAQEDIINLTEATISGSIAMNSELDRTATLVGAVINTFEDLETTDAAKVIDILSLATAKSALNFQKLETGLPIVAGAADAAGIPFTTLVALLGKLADSGIDVSSSSTSLRNIFIESAKQGLKYSEIIQKIKDSQDKLTVANDEFGKRAAVSATVLAKNIDSVTLLDEALQGAAGTAERMANKELDTLDGSLKLLRSAWEGFILNLDESTGAAGNLKNVVGFLARNLKQIFSTIGFVVKAWLAYIIVTRLARIQTSLVSKQLRATRAAALASAKGINTATLAFAKFNKVLKANALGIAIAAIAGIILLYQKYNKTLAESVENTNEATQSFIDSRREQNQVSDSLKKMSDRYEVLSNKTDLNKEEQQELDDIVKEIAKTVPQAVIEIDKYGNALKINTEEVKKFNKVNEQISGQRETTLLRENIQQLELLEKQQKKFNKVKEEEERFYVDGVGFIANYNGVLKEQITLSDQYGVKTFDGNVLSSKQLELVQKAIKDNEDNIAAKKKFIETLTKEGRANKKAREEAERKAESDAKTAKEAEVLADKKADEILKISELKDKIKELKAEQEGLTKADGARAQEVNKLLKIYQKEIDTILGVSKANKSAEKAEKERQAKLKKLAQDAFNLKKFFLDKEIKAQNEVLTNEDKSFSEREIALAEKARLELEFVFLTSKNKFDLEKEFSDKEIETLLNKGEVSKDTLKKVSDEEILIIEDYQTKKAAILKGEEDSQDNIEANKIKSRAEKSKAELEKRINDEIRLENEAFSRREGIYADSEKAVEVREKRIAEIKRKYALEGLNAQVKAVEILLETEELSANKRAEYEVKLAKIKRQISGLDVEKFVADNDTKSESEKNTSNEILEISSELAFALQDLGNSLFDSKIQKIEDEITKNDEKFERLLDNENLSVEQRKQIEQQQENERQELEKKKRKEQRKQAIFNKAMAIADIGIRTAQAIIGIWAQVPKFDFGISAGALTGFVSALGAIQLGAVLAQKIPAYFKGTDDHPGGLAMVGEVRPEVIQEPNKAPYVVDKPSIIDLPKGTKVTPSVKEYESLFRASTLASLEVEDKKISDHEARMAFNSYYNFNTGKIESELSALRKDIRTLAGRPVKGNFNITLEQPTTGHRT